MLPYRRTLYLLQHKTKLAQYSLHNTAALCTTVHLFSNSIIGCAVRGESVYAGYFELRVQFVGVCSKGKEMRKRLGGKEESEWKPKEILQIFSNIEEKSTKNIHI